MKIEYELARQFAKYRKELHGTGAIDTQVRICADTLLIRYKVTYTPLEEIMINYIISENGDFSLPDYESKIKSVSNQVISSIFPRHNMKIIGAYPRICLKEEVSYWLIVLDTNVEKIVREQERRIMSGLKTKNIYCV